MKNKIEATIQIDDMEKAMKIIGEVEELCYDSSYPSMTLEIKNAKFIEEKTTEDYIETDNKTYWKFNIVDYIDDLIQERLKVAKLDD